MTATDHPPVPPAPVPRLQEQPGRAPGATHAGSGVVRDQRLLRQADALLQPGFVGTTPPDWVRRRLAEGLGGIALFARNIVDMAQLTGLTTALTAENPDVIIAVDEESGDVTRLEVPTGSSRPGNLALGVVDDPVLTEAVAADIGAQLAAAGITLNYAPTADVNNNPGNPVIGVRSFGADPQLVAVHTAAWVRGLQRTGVAACAKHFPGHGDTGMDSHYGLPIIDAPFARLDAVELPPFAAAVHAGARAVMTAHLLVPALDPERPATLSPAVLVQLLRERLGFAGLVVTDAIEMASIAQRYGLARAAVLAVAAGADAICVGGENADESIATLLRDSLVDAVMSGELPEERLADAAQRIADFAAESAATRAARKVAADGWAAQPDVTAIGLVAARRAVRVTGSPGAADAGMTGPMHVVEFNSPIHMAIDRRTPWGVGAPLKALRPETTVTRLDATATVAEVLAGAEGRLPVLVCRDAHRHPDLLRLVTGVLAARPDAVVVEMGVPGAEPLRAAGGLHLATFGAAAVCGQAAAEILARLRR